MHGLCATFLLFEDDNDGMQDLFVVLDISKNNNLREPTECF